MCDLVNQLLAVKAISDKDMAKLKSDKYLFYDPLILMDLRHEQVRKKFKKATKCSSTKTSDIKRSRILREEEQRKRVKMRELSIVNRKLEDFKKEIELSKKRFQKHATNLDTSFDFNENKSTVKAPLPVSKDKTAETVHLKVQQSFKNKTIRLSDESSDCNVQDFGLKSLKVKDTTLFSEKTEVISKFNEVQSEHHQTDYHEKENLSEPSSSTEKCQHSVECSCLNVEVSYSNDNLSKLGDLINANKSVCEVVNSSAVIVSVHDEVNKCVTSVCKDTNTENICRSNDNNSCGRQATVIQKDSELCSQPPKDSSHQELKVSEQNFYMHDDIKMRKDDISDLVKDINELNTAEIQSGESNLHLEKGRTSEERVKLQHTKFEGSGNSKMENSLKKELAVKLVRTIARQNIQKNLKKMPFKKNEKKGISLAANENTCPGNDRSRNESERSRNESEILHKYWKLWKDHTFSEVQKTKVDRLLNTLKEFQKNEQQGQHVQQRSGCHSAGCVLESQNLQKSGEDTTDMIYSKNRKNRRKSVHCQAMPMTSDMANKRRGRERSKKLQTFANDIENRVRELSAERQKRETALSQDKEEMQLKPYGKVPLWVLQPTRLIATESIRRATERQEAIKLRLETKRLREEQLAAAERMRLEAEAERVHALRELAWTRYRQRVSRRLLLEPLRALVAESNQKQAQASVFASHLLLRKYWKAWRQIITKKMSAFSEALNRFRMRRAFQGLLEIKADAMRRCQVAQDFYEAWILERRVFVQWRSFTLEQLAWEETIMEAALHHYNSTLLQHCFRQWCKVRVQKKRRERLEVWRIRVREVLPDFMPPETD